MRTYDIIDSATGSVVGQQICEDILAPVLMAGQEAQLTHIDDEAVTDAAGFQNLTPDPTQPVAAEPAATPAAAQPFEPAPAAQPSAAPAA